MTEIELEELKIANLRLKKVLQECEAQISGELERGYVLTHEPLAGLLWRQRWNVLLGKVEAALKR